MIKHIVLMAALALALGCSKKDKDAPAEGQAKTTDKGKPDKDKVEPTDKDKVEPTDKGKVEPAGAMTGEQTAARYQECMAAWSAKDEAKFRECMTADGTVEMVDSGMPAATGPDGAIGFAKAFWTGFPDVKLEPQLIMVNKDTIVSIDLVTGTHTGDFNGIPATSKKIGLRMVHVIATDGAGKAKQVWAFLDQGTMLGHLGLNPSPVRPVMDKGAATPTIVVAPADGPDSEAKLAIARKGVEGVNAHDIAALTATLSDDSMESDQTAPEDLKGKDKIGEHVGQFFTAFPDVKLTVDKEIAMGDYVVNIGTFTGTNTGDMPAWGLKKTDKPVKVTYVEIMKIADGKITETWRFWNGFAMATQLGLVPPQK